MTKLNKLKKLFNSHNIQGYIIPKNDEFFNEYVPENKDNLKFISDFSGSYGFALILKKSNYLFVDGRYTLQAEMQSGKEYKIITIPNKFPFNIIKNKKISIGFDPKLHTERMLINFFTKTNCKLIPLHENLIDKIWKKKNTNKYKKFYKLKDNESGQSSTRKINKLSKFLKVKKIDCQFVSASENVAWLLNLRGADSDFSPLPNSYLIINSNKKVYFFCDLKKINKKLKNDLNKNIIIININKIDQFILKIKNKKIQLDSNSCSIFYKNIFKDNNKIIEKQDPIYLLKSLKNKVEIKNTIKTHIYDGVALTKFLLWLTRNFSKKKVTEISAQKKLLKFRKKNKTFKSLSFPTISGSGPNGAIIHYKANNKSNRTLKKGDIYLVDSGGQYNFGTTDVTRTISLNNTQQRVKNIFTRVLKGHIAVANYKIKKNTCGGEIDVEARKPLQEINLDYAHGTGHGVGYFLNVHEGPQAISRGNKVKLKEGMILSNEPGYYENGKFGIRIENLLAVRKIKKNFKFENLTLAPIDKSLIEKKLLNKSEIRWLNNYHSKVYYNLKKYMSKNDLAMFKNCCSNI
ncbi:MAG TPA: aminopeptidase P family protein [Candidatus Pelagibacter sp.]|jgi:Xaa-Pro aminopeptidase|nr:aminopeptidase P family protein [Candidatus Pelagibacter sp.]